MNTAKTQEQSSRRYTQMNADNTTNTIRMRKEVPFFVFHPSITVFVCDLNGFLNFIRVYLRLSAAILFLLLNRSQT